MPFINLKNLTTVLLFGSVTVAASASIPAMANLRSETVRYNAAILEDYCTLTSVDGALGGTQDRKILTSDPNEINGPAFSIGTPAKVEATSNLAGVGSLIAQTPTLEGVTAPDNSQLAFTGEEYGPTSTIPLGADGNASTELNVLFNSTRFDSGTYRATAVVTCNN